MEIITLISCILSLFIAGYISYKISSRKIRSIAEKVRNEQQTLIYASEQKGKKIIADAQKRAEEIVNNFKLQSNAEANNPEKDADEIIMNAKKEADRIIAEASRKSNSMQQEMDMNKIDALKEKTYHILQTAKEDAAGIISQAKIESDSIIGKSAKEHDAINLKIEYANEQLKILKKEILQEQDTLNRLKKRNLEEESNEIIEKARQEAESIINQAHTEVKKIFVEERGLFYGKKLNEWAEDKKNIKDILTRNYPDLDIIQRELKENQNMQTEEFRGNGGYNIVDNIPRLISYYEFHGISHVFMNYFNDKCQRIIKEGIKKDLFTKQKEMEGLRYSLEISGSFFDFKISDKFFSLMIAQMALYHKFQQIRAEKKEMEAMQRKALAEQIRAQKELEREIARAQKDEEQAKLSLEKAEEEMRNTSVDQEKYNKLMEKIASLQNALAEAQSRMERATSMAQQTRSGWVYVISNIGSFGEDVYKIGMTRRLDPMERVIELGDASVPFPFDVHALIYSEDAPALETALHKAFYDKKVNSVNGKKEFFKVSLSEIKQGLKKSGYEVEFIDVPVAQQYRDTLFACSSIQTV